MKMSKRKYAKKVKGHGQRILKVCFAPCRCFSVGKRSKLKFKEVS